MSQIWRVQGASKAPKSSITPLHRLCSPQYYSVHQLRGGNENLSSLQERTTSAKIKEFYEQEVVHALGEEGIAAKIDEQLHARDDFGNTPLHYACQWPPYNEPVRVVSWLLSEGANPNSENVFGETPFHMAARRGLEDCCRLLFKANGSLYHLDSFGATPKHDALSSRYASKMQLLFAELAESHVTPLQYLCREAIVNAMGGNSSYVSKIDGLPLPLRMRGFIGGPDYQERARLQQAREEKQTQSSQRSMANERRKRTCFEDCTIL